MEKNILAWRINDSYVMIFAILMLIILGPFMKSKTLQQDHDGLIRLTQRMRPEERLVAFLNHSRLMHQLYRSGQEFRSSSPTDISNPSLKNES